MASPVRVVAATCSEDELRRRMERLERNGHGLTLAWFELSEELYLRTGGREGTDPGLRPWVRMFGGDGP
jgi:hypothetical protein